MSEAYKIGVAIMLHDSMSPVLSAISRRLIGVHKSVKEIESGFSRWGLAIRGAASVFAGGELLKGVAGLAMHAKEFHHELAKAGALGLDMTQMSEVATKAWENSRAVMGTTVAGNVKTIGSLYSIVGLDEALKLSTKFERADQVLQAVGKGEEGSAYVLARAGELMGKFTDVKTGKLDVGLFSGFLDTITRSVIATHGMVGAREWLNYAKQAGPAAGNLTEDGMLTTTAVMQAMGGYRAGTAAAALNRQFAGGIMTQRVARELTRLGIAQQGDFEVARGGQVIAKTGAMQDLVTTLQRDPLDAIVSKIVPALEKAGYNTNEKLAAEIYRMIGTGPAQREVYELIRGRFQIAQERERAKGALGVDAGYANFAKNDPAQVMKGFTAAWENMLTAMGSSALKAAIPLILQFTDVLNRVSKFANANPTAMLTIAEGITAVGAALVGAGAVAIMAAIGPAGWITGGVLALGLALLSVPWKSLWEGFGDLISKVGSAIAGAIAAIKAALGGGLGVGAPQPKDGMGGDGAPLIPLGPRQPGFRKQGYNAVPPPRGGGEGATRLGLHVDGRKFAEVIVPHMARDANGPLRGSAHYDGTATFVPADYAYARG